MRRRWVALIIVVACVGVLAVAVYHHGVRYPPLQFEPAPAVTSAAHPRAGYRVTGRGALYRNSNGDGLEFRAFSPQPELLVETTAASVFGIQIGNVHPGATLTASDPSVTFQEHIEGLVRSVEGRARAPMRFALRWRFPKTDVYRFTVIGDSGGGKELLWLLTRSTQLGADFVLHLGDLNYMPGDFERAVTALNASAVPVYVAIGNHDFHAGGRSVHDFFTRHIGPRNSTFELGGVRFVNLDTAADSFPASRGARARLIAGLPGLNESALAIRDYVVFTHRPLSDPRPEQARDNEHAVSGLGEAGWLRSQLLRRGVRRLMAGHLHIATRFDDRGLETYISGEGLAHADLIVERPVARLLVADVTPEQPVQYRWVDLNMPADAHCNPRAWEVLERLGKREELARLRRVCG